MRKVTASAVILTALTGCSQSNVPSTQWSFNVPEEDTAGRLAEATSENALDGGTDTVLASNGTLASETLVSGQSEDGQALVSQAANSRMMGPAFEQPSAEVPLGARVSTVGRPGSQEISTLAAEAYGITSGLSAQPSTRPDPIAQVRAYLRSSGSPSALTNRTPYNSEVYLSSLPAPNRYYEPSIPIVETNLPTNMPGLGLTESLSDAFSNTNAVITEPISSSFGAESFTASSFETGNFETGNFETGSFETGNFETDNFEAISSDTVSTDTAAFIETVPQSTLSESSLSQADRFDEGLPRLEAAQLTVTNADTYASLPTPASESSDSIGTAILQNLREQSSTSTESLQTESLQTESLQTESLQTENFESENFVSEAESIYAYTPSIEDAQPLPTLASLTETMPARDISPLIDSFRSGNTSSSVPETSVLDHTPDSEANLEAFSESAFSESAFNPAEQQQSLTTERSYEHTSENADVSGAYSPLLAGFSETKIEPTIYVPIAKDPAVSSDLMLQGIADTLSNSTRSESSMVSNSPEALTVSNILPANLESTFVLAPNLITLTSLQPQNKDAVQSKRSVAHRNDAITLVAKQASQRRQRLTWM